MCATAWGRRVCLSHSCYKLNFKKFDFAVIAMMICRIIFGSTPSQIAAIARFEHLKAANNIKPVYFHLQTRSTKLEFKSFIYSNLV